MDGKIINKTVDIFEKLLLVYVKNTSRCEIRNYILNKNDYNTQILVDRINWEIKSEYDFLTGIGILNAIEDMIKDATENGNL